ncbi:uncharacterized protein LOC110855703 [Folsomia candida]|uniref:uncharacterized protein LOC110855703 n=1 Tax=Folsomia candida TaxID=158441 RepID=UPI000B8F1786|nr:uncharacterized protein LOC110855703 [Folsomia candida]
MELSVGLSGTLILLVFASQAVTAAPNEMGTTQIHSLSGSLQLPEFLATPISFLYKIKVTPTGSNQTNLQTNSIPGNISATIRPNKFASTLLASTYFLSYFPRRTLGNIHDKSSRN